MTVVNENKNVPHENSGSEYIIEMRNITKEFPGIKANDNITLQLKRGEIHALLGENGAGKSTLMSVLFGLYKPEEGEILKNGEVVKINDPNDATALGIGMVHQHFKLVECFTVLDNIILGAEDTRFGFIKKRTREKRSVNSAKSTVCTLTSTKNRRYYRGHATAYGDFKNVVSRQRDTYF